MTPSSEPLCVGRVLAFRNFRQETFAGSFKLPRRKIQRRVNMRNYFNLLSVTLGILGFALWIAAVVLLIPNHASDTSIVHFRVGEAGIVIGGACLVGAIALFANSD